MGHQLLKIHCVLKSDNKSICSELINNQSSHDQRGLRVKNKKSPNNINSKKYKV